VLISAKAEFKVGGIGVNVIGSPFPDSFDFTFSNLVIVSVGIDWREFSIDVIGRDLKYVIGGFMVVTNTTQNFFGVILFLDDIVWC